MGAGASVSDRVNVMAYGFKPNPRQRLLPVTSHMAQVIFDMNKIIVYAQANRSSCERTEYIEIEADSAQQFAASLENKLDLTGSYGFKAGASIAATVAAEIGLNETSNKEMHYAQKREIYEYVSVTLPGTSEAHFEELRNLMVPKVQAELDACDTREKAKQIIKSYGPFYIRKGIFGATYVMTAKMEKENWTSTEKLVKALTGNAGLLGGQGKAENVMEVKDEKTGKTATSDVSLEGVGGDPKLFSKKPEWITTTSSNPVLVKFLLGPISDLVEKEETKCLLDQAINENLQKSIHILKMLDGEMEKISKCNASKKVSRHKNYLAILARLEQIENDCEKEAIAAQGLLDSWLHAIDHKRNENWRQHANECKQNLRELIEASKIDTYSEFQEKIKQQIVSHTNFHVNWGLANREGIKCNEIHNRIGKQIKQIARDERFFGWDEKKFTIPT